MWLATGNWSQAWRFSKIDDCCCWAQDVNGRWWNGFPIRFSMKRQLWSLHRKHKPTNSLVPAFGGAQGEMKRLLSKLKGERLQGFLKLKRMIRLCNKMHRMIRLCQCPYKVSERLVVCLACLRLFTNKHRKLRICTVLLKFITECLLLNDSIYWILLELRCWGLLQTVMTAPATVSKNLKKRVVIKIDEYCR